MVTPKPYTSVEDLQSIVGLTTPENLRLEYKGSRVIENSETNVICKAVTAFANSTGGQLIIGIAPATKHQALRLDSGVQGASRLDWLYQVISANTSPPVEGIEIAELAAETGRYYIISVPASPQAPHQSSDHKYYKRRGSHSEPMEHYEIEDVRNRPKAPLAPLAVSLAKDEGIAFLRLKNGHATDDLTDVICQIDSNVEFQNDGVDVLATQGLRRIPPQEELHFLLDSIGMMLSRSRDARFSVSAEYSFRGERKRNVQTFHMADFQRSAIFREPMVKALLKLDERLERLNRHVNDLVGQARKIETIADGSGLRLSQRTLTLLRGGDQLFDPHEFDHEGYQIILDLSSEEAMQLSQIFHTIIPPAQARREYAALSPELREKFEKRFRLDFADE